MSLAQMCRNGIAIGIVCRRQLHLADVRGNVSVLNDLDQALGTDLVCSVCRGGRNDAQQEQEFAR